MIRTTPLRSTLVIGVLVGIVATGDAQPRGKAKPGKPATQADIERLERKIDDQQKVIVKLVKLHQQYVQAMASLVDGNAAPDPVVEKPAEKPIEKVVEKPVEKPAEKRAPEPVAAKVAAKPKKPAGVGSVVGKVAGAPDAVLYIEDIVVGTQGTATMKQEGKQFLPQVLVVQKGTKVEFPNRDAIFHNVFSVSPDNSFDLGSYQQGESKSVTMSKAGVVTVYCNMHPQMVGHILVVPNANYVRAGKDGFFRLTNVPAGQHKVVAWAPNSKPTSVMANVTEDGVVTVELELKKGRTMTHTKKDGLPYGSYEQ